MRVRMHVLLAAVPVFLASIVEVVEAFTITLAVGVTRGWKSAILGMATALVILIGAAWVIGPRLVDLVDEHALELVIGVLLLLFGVRWLRKAILRYAGVVALHDEALVYAQEVAELSGEAETAKGIDWPGFFISFKGTLLEGLEVVFLILTVGAVGDGELAPAVIGAAVAFVLVAVVVALARAPLTRVPENTLKFAVGIVITTFGIYWTSEGLGAQMPGNALFLLPLMVTMLAMSWAFVRFMERTALGSDQPSRFR
jgi:uncharacterized membrane protein